MYIWIKKEKKKKIEHKERWNGIMKKINSNIWASAEVAGSFEAVGRCKMRSLGLNDPSLPQPMHLLPSSFTFPIDSHASRTLLYCYWDHWSVFWRSFFNFILQSLSLFCGALLPIGTDCLSVLFLSARHPSYPPRSCVALVVVKERSKAYERTNAFLGLIDNKKSKSGMNLELVVKREQAKEWRGNESVDCVALIALRSFLPQRLLLCESWKLGF